MKSDFFSHGLPGIELWRTISPKGQEHQPLQAIKLSLDVALTLATYFVFCALWTGCEGWPNAWLWNWANLIASLLAVAAATLQLRRDQIAR